MYYVGRDKRLARKKSDGHGKLLEYGNSVNAQVGKTLNNKLKRVAKKLRG
jgi:hypothetical protein